jgi:hypothetical protein
MLFCKAWFPTGIETELKAEQKSARIELIMTHDGTGLRVVRSAQKGSVGKGESNKGMPEIAGLSRSDRLKVCQKTGWQERSYQGICRPSAGQVLKAHSAHLPI